MVSFNSLQAVVFGAYDLVVESNLCILSCKQFTAVLVLFSQVAAPESLDFDDFLIKLFLT